MMLIDRMKVIKEIGEKSNNLGEKGRSKDWNEGYKEALLTAIKTVFEQDSVDTSELFTISEAMDQMREDRLMRGFRFWIPCSQKLPEEETIYLVTFASGQVGTSSWHKDTKHNRGFDMYMTGICEDDSFKYFGVIAWMPLPEPYKGKDGGGA